MKELAFITIIILSLIIFPSWGLISFGRYMDRIACQSFSQESNRETRFVEYNYMHWDCLTPSGDNKWISTSALRDLN